MRYNHFFKEDAESDAGSGAASRDFVAEAAKMGHVPKEKWTGDPDKWVDAQTFVEKADQVLPIIRQQKRDLEAQLRTVREELAQTRKDTAEFATFVEKSSKREREELEGQLAEALAARAEAVTTGDGNAFTKADVEVEKLKEQARDIAVKPKSDAAKEAAKAHPDLPAWLEDNPWYETNQDYRVEANGIAAAMQVAAKNRGQDLNGRKLFDAVAIKMSKLYPDDIKIKGEESRASAVEGGRDTEPTDKGNSRGGGKAQTYANLPPEAKATCERYIKNNWTGKKKPEDFRKAFAAEYDWS